MVGEVGGCPLPPSVVDVSRVRREYRHPLVVLEFRLGQWRLWRRPSCWPQPCLGGWRTRGGESGGGPDAQYRGHGCGTASRGTRCRWERRFCLPTPFETTTEEEKRGVKPRWAWCRYSAMVRISTHHIFRQALEMSSRRAGQCCRRVSSDILGEEEKVEEERVSEVRMPTIAAIDVVPHPAVPFGGVHQGGEACLPADVIGGNRGGGEARRQVAVGLMPTLHHGEDFDLSHAPASLGDVEQEGGAVLPTGLFGYLGEDEEKVEEEERWPRSGCPPSPPPMWNHIPRYPSEAAIRGGRRVYLPTSQETTTEENGGGKPRWA
ncbi:unnamed protein product [Ectocarpus sp. 12 AP-2014]